MASYDGREAGQQVRYGLQELGRYVVQAAQILAAAIKESK